MSLASAVGAGRAAAEATYADVFTAWSPAVVATGGMKEPGYASEGIVFGKIQAGSQASADTSTRTVSVGGVELPVITGGLHIPFSATAPVGGVIGIGWEYELTTVGPVTDPSLEGSRWLVVDAPAKSYATARRLDVVRLS